MLIGLEAPVFRAHTRMCGEHEAEQDAGCQEAFLVVCHAESLPASPVGIGKRAATLGVCGHTRDLFFDRKPHAHGLPVSAAQRLSRC